MPVAMPRFYGQNRSFPQELAFDDSLAFELRPATVKDVHGMSSLINQYAGANVMLARGPQYLYQHIQDYMVITTRANAKDIVIACGALHVLWEDLAEIRSIAVQQSCQGRGLAKRLVEALVKRCQTLEIPRVFVFTLAAGFFEKCGFIECDRTELPPFVWVECSKCPKFYRCDEIGMIKNIELNK